MTYAEDAAAVGARADADLAQRDLLIAELRAEIARLTPAEPEPAPVLTLRVDASVEGELALSWSLPVTESGRDGTDTTGHGPWSSPETPTATGRTFKALRPDTTYTLHVVRDGVRVTIQGRTKTSDAPTPVTPPVTPPAGAGTVWLSGACDDNAADTAGGGFGTWRGEPATFARMWGDASIAAMQSLDMMMPYKNANWNGVLDMAIGGPRDGQSWGSAATGGMDSIWRGQCQKINANWWPNCKGIHLSMAHELSGNWYPWSVNSGNLSAFKSAWRRFYNIVQEELVSKGRKVKVTLNYNFDTVANVSVQQINPGNDVVDIVGVDVYNMWWGGSAASGLNDQTTWNNNLNAMKGASPKGIGAWFTYAEQIGKPLSIPEWGLSPQAHVDSPFFVTAMRNFLATKAPADPYNPGAGKLAGDAYFNTWDYCRLYPTTSKPNAAAAYRAAMWGRTA